MAAAFTCSEDVPVLPDGECVPVTVCGPTKLELQLLAVHLPSGAMLKVVAAVTWPRSWLKASCPRAVYDSGPPTVMVALAGARTRRSIAPADTDTPADPAIELVTVSVTVMLCAPAIFSVTLKLCVPASAAVKLYSA